MRFSIRRIDVADPIVRAGLKALIYEVFNDGMLAKGYKPAPEGYWLLAYAGEDVAGFAGLVPSTQWADTGYLTLSGVLPAYRGWGLQRRFIKKRIERAVELRWHTLVTEVISGNGPSMRNLFKCGFLPYVPKKPWGTEEATYWRKRLTKETYAV